MKSGKVTSGGKAGGKRWYDDACGAALGLELVGERWSLLVIRELLLGPRRFGELRAGLAGISANVLQQRLEGLAAAGLLVRRPLPSPANADVYELTPWGYEAEVPIQALGRWALRSFTHDPTLPLTPAAAMLSLRYLMDGEAAAGQAMTIGFRFGGDAFTVRLAGGRLAIDRGKGPADATVTTDPTNWIYCVYGKRPMADAEAAGTIAVTGDRAVLARFIDLFALPAKAAVE